MHGGGCMWLCCNRNAAGGGEQHRGVGVHCMGVSCMGGVGGGIAQGGMHVVLLQ